MCIYVKKLISYKCWSFWLYINSVKVGITLQCIYGAFEYMICADLCKKVDFKLPSKLNIPFFAALEIILKISIENYFSK